MFSLNCKGFKRPNATLQMVMIKMDVIEIIFLVEKAINYVDKSSSSRSIIMQESHLCSVGCVFRSLEQM
jgi:hypothetical protein